MTTFGLYGARLSLAVWRHFTCNIFFVFTYYVVLSLKNKYTILYYKEGRGGRGGREGGREGGRGGDGGRLGEGGREGRRLSYPCIKLNMSAYSATAVRLRCHVFCSCSRVTESSFQRRPWQELSWLTLVTSCSDGLLTDSFLQ